MPNAGKTRRSVAAGETWIEVRVSDEDKTQLMAWSKRTGLSASLLMRACWRKPWQMDGEHGETFLRLVFPPSRKGSDE